MTWKHNESIALFEISGTKCKIVGNDIIAKPSLRQYISLAYRIFEERKLGILAIFANKLTSFSMMIIWNRNEKTLVTLVM